MLYLTNPQNITRYLLGDEVDRPLWILGLNPSTATDLKPDMTNTKAKRFAQLDGFEGYVIINLYPQRSTFPHLLHKRGSSLYLKENLSFITTYMAKTPMPVIWAAWGNLIETRPYLIKSLKMIVEATVGFSPKWIHRGLTKKGHPRHPSRLGYQAPVENFDVEDYLEKWGKKSR